MKYLIVVLVASFSASAFAEERTCTRQCKVDQSVCMQSTRGIIAARTRYEARVKRHEYRERCHEEYRSCLEDCAKEEEEQETQNP